MYLHFNVHLICGNTNCCPSFAPSAGQVVFQKFSLKLWRHEERHKQHKKGSELCAIVCLATNTFQLPQLLLPFAKLRIFQKKKSELWKIAQPESVSCFIVENSLWCKSWLVHSPSHCEFLPWTFRIYFNYLILLWYIHRNF